MLINLLLSYTSVYKATIIINKIGGCPDHFNIYIFLPCSHHLQRSDLLHVDTDETIGPMEGSTDVGKC